MFVFFIHNLIHLAIAQEDDTAASLSFEELGWVPPFQVAAFVDQKNSGDCDPIDARYGRCIERVDFYNSIPVWVYMDQYADLKDAERLSLQVLYDDMQLWTNASITERQEWKKADKARTRLLAELYAQNLEDIVFRWKIEDDPAIEALKTDGFKIMPDPMSQWSTFHPSRKISWAEPMPSSYLNPQDWMQMIVPITDPKKAVPSLQNRSAYYAKVRHAIPTNHFIEPTPSILMKGRFAVRLAFKGKAHDYNMMDADPLASGPFFEQLYPYQTMYQLDDLELIPLSDFRYPGREALEKSSAISNVIMVDSFEDTKAQASKHFSSFYRLVGTQVMQFAMQDYTVNHMRILGALSMMRTPPGNLEGATGVFKDPNAATIGQTDSKASQEKKIQSGYTLPGGVQLNYRKLPEPLVIQTLEYLQQNYPQELFFYAQLTQQVEGLFPDLLKSDVKNIRGVTDQELFEWVLNNKRPERDGEIIIKRLRYFVLEYYMSSLSDDDRNREESWLLMDHFNYSVMSDMDGTLGVKINPLDMSGLTSGKWETVLADHYYTTQNIDQGLGAIDPTAVCTQGSRLDALEETTIGAINVDQLFAGDDIRLNPDLSNDDLLWNARHDLPFIMFDSPSITAPSVQRLVGLPDGQALYRVRWQVWSGWHLLWGIEKMSGRSRLVLKTAAMCDNMVMAPPDLVATVVRAGLLEDQFYPTIPADYWDMRGRDDYPSAQERQDRRRKNKKNKDTLDRKDVLNEISQSSYGIEQGVQDTQNLMDRLNDPTLTKNDVQTLAKADLGTRNIRNVDLSPQKPATIEVTETVDYFRWIARSPLEAKSKDKGLLFFVHDFDQAETVDFLKDGLARTPYARAHQVLGKEHVQGAGWALYFKKDSIQPAIKAAPNYRPAANYLAGSVVPTFQRVTTNDATFTLDLGAFPYRESFYTCNPEVNATSLFSVSQCDPNSRYKVITDGLSIGFSSFTTKWFRDDPHVAYELGWEMHADILHAGQTWFTESESPDISIIADRLNGKKVGNNSSDDIVIFPSYTWSLRPQTGPTFGFRHIPDPSPLYRSFRHKSTWGAMDSSGSSILKRPEWGVRGGMMIGPSFNGLEGTLMAEAWMGSMIRNPRSDWAYHSPYHPIWNGGLFFRMQRGAVMVPSDADRVFDLLYSNTYVVGWRTQFRLPEARPE